MKCGTCKYRGEEILRDDFEKDEFDIPTGFFQCTRIKHLAFYPGKAQPRAKAYVVDGSDYFGQLRVAEDFGCVEYQVKL